MYTFVVHVIHKFSEKWAKSAKMIDIALPIW